MDVAAQIFQTAQTYGVDPRLAYEVANEESGANPNVRDGGAGEIGIFQVLPSTGAGLGFSATDLRDPVKNIQAGVMYLAQNLTAFGGDAAKAVAAYNAGPGAVQSALAQAAASGSGDSSNWFSYLPSSTQGYVQAILSAANAYTTEPGGTEFSAAVGGISLAAIGWLVGVAIFLGLAFEGTAD